MRRHRTEFVRAFPARIALLALLASIHCATRARAESPTIGAGDAHTCAIDGANALWCWGAKDDDRCDAPRGPHVAVAVAKGGCHACAIASDASMSCWGCDERLQASGIPTSSDTLRGWVAVACGKAFSCGIVNDGSGNVRCWGEPLPAIGTRDAWVGPFATVVAGEDYVCALGKDDGLARCRGWDSSAQASIPATLANVAFVAIAAGFAHTCGVTRTEKSLRCWGGNVAGESALPNATSAGGDGGGYATGANVAAAAWGAIGVGARWTCGVVGSARELTCWGLRRDYPPAAAAHFEEYGQVHSSGAVVSKNGACAWDVVAVGKRHACGITASSSDAGPAGSAMCWGDDSHGQSAPPGEGDGVVLPWKAWPTETEVNATGSAILALKTSAGATALCDADVVASGSAGVWRARAVKRRALASLIVAAAVVAVVGVAGLGEGASARTSDGRVPFKPHAMKNVGPAMRG